MRYNISGLEYYVYNKDIKGSTTNIIDNNKNAKISYKYSDFGETREIGDTDFYKYTRVDGLEFGGFSFGATVQINVYPSNNTIKSLSGKSFNAGATINTTVVNVSGGVSIGLENKNKGITPSVSGNVGGVVRFSTPINVYVTHSKTETLQFPFSIDSFLKRPKNTKKQYSFRGSKITLKNKNKKFIELNSNKMYGKIYSNKKVYIYKK